MTTLERLLDIHEIKQVKYRYLRALDTRQWELMRSCFAPDARTWYSGGRLCSEGGADGVIALLSGMIGDGLASSHIALHPEIEFTGPATAKGVWRFQDLVHHGATEGGGVFLIGAGYYYDEYEKGADGWRIKSTGYERIFETTEDKGGDPSFAIKIHPRLGVRDSDGSAGAK